MSKYSHLLVEAKRTRGEMEVGMSPAPQYDVAPNVPDDVMRIFDSDVDFDSAEIRRLPALEVLMEDGAVARLGPGVRAYARDYGNLPFLYKLFKANRTADYFFTKLARDAGFPDMRTVIDTFRDDRARLTRESFWWINLDHMMHGSELEAFAVMAAVEPNIFGTVVEKSNMHPTPRALIQTLWKVVNKDDPGAVEKWINEEFAPYYIIVYLVAVESGKTERTYTVSRFSMMVNAKAFQRDELVKEWQDAATEFNKATRGKTSERKVWYKMYVALTRDTELVPYMDSSYGAVQTTTVTTGIYHNISFVMMAPDGKELATEFLKLVEGAPPSTTNVNMLPELNRLTRGMAKAF